MKKPVIKIEYRLESDLMTDEEYENQEEKTFIVTEEMLYNLVEENVILEEGYSIDDVNFYINKI